MTEELNLDLVNSPDALKADPESMAFYILRDEQVVICKTRKDVPYWKNRSTYLSEGRYSPKYKKVVFWPNPVNPSRAIHLLTEQQHIEEDYTFAVVGSAVKAPKYRPKDPVEKLSGVRKREVEVLMERGLRRQVRDTESKEGDG